MNTHSARPFPLSWRQKPVLDRVLASLPPFHKVEVLLLTGPQRTLEQLRCCTCRQLQGSFDCRIPSLRKSMAADSLAIPWSPENNWGQKLAGSSTNSPYWRQTWRSEAAKSWLERWTLAGEIYKVLIELKVTVIPRNQSVRNKQAAKSIQIMFVVENLQVVTRFWGDCRLLKQLS